MYKRTSRKVGKKKIRIKKKRLEDLNVLLFVLKKCFPGFFNRAIGGLNVGDYMGFLHGLAGDKFFMLGHFSGL